MAAEGRKQSPADGGDTLLERERELAAIDALTGVVVAGSGRVVLIEGPPGIGKSRLLAEAASRAGAQGLQVLTARSSELEREFAFGIVRQLFEAILVRPDARRRWLSGSAGVAAPVFESVGVEADADHPDPSFATLHGLYWLTVNVATDRPLVLSIDDIQWCDQPSIRFLAYLAHRLDGLPVLIAVGHRTAAVEAELVLLEEIARAAVTTSIHPAPFSEVAVQTVVRERLGVDPDPAFAAACRQVTGGNPFLVRELLRALEAESVPPDAAHVDAIRYLGPRAVSRTVLLRLARLPAEGIAVARAAAVLGDGAGLAAISGLTGLDAQQVADATRSLVDADILRPEPPLGFVHPLVQAAVYHGLTPAERELVHARAARLLLESGAEDERVAAHLLAIPTGAEPWGVEVLRKAGRTAVLKGAPESAISYFRRALDHGPVTEARAGLLLELGMAEALINAPAATEHLEAARNALSDPVARGRAARVLAQIMIFTRPPAEAVAVVKEAVAELPSEHGDLRQALEATGFYAVDFGAPEADAASGLARARQRVVGDGPGARMLQAVAAWDLALSGGSAADSVGLAQSALAGGVLVAADPAFTTLVATSVLALADRDEALPGWEAALAEAQRRGSLDGLSGVHLWRGWTWLQRGELEEAESSLRQAIEDSKLWNSEEGAGLPYAQAFLARVLVERGNLTEARTVLSRRTNPVPMSDADGLCRRSQVELLLAEGQWEAARQAADEYSLCVRRIVNPGWAPWRSLKAQALYSLGRSEDALTLVEEELVFARRWGAPGTVCQTLRVLGMLDRQGGLDALDEAVDVTRASPARLEHAKALAAWGAGLRRAARPREARVPLRAALDLAARCGAARLVEAARSDLYAAGGRPRREALLGVEALTPSERRVADLAATGHSNRDIAQSLFITPKTVELHLSSAYGKLDIRSRGDLGAALSPIPRG